MRGLAGALVVFALSLGAGSWVGVCRPDAARLSWPTREVGPAARKPAPGPRPLDGPPLPQEIDPSLVPAFAPWPKDNPEASLTRAWRLASGPTRRPGDERRLVTLTFDDGPSLEATPRILRCLDAHHVRATFFVVGRYLDGSDERADRRREILQRVDSAGHLIGNHTHDHANLTRLEPVEARAQIDRGAASIARVIGKKPILFRPPYGLLDETGEQMAHARGLDLVLWSVEAADMLRDNPDAMFDDVVEQLEQKDGGIVLLHDMKPSSVVVLERLLAYLEKRAYDPLRPERSGFEIVDLPEYLRAVSQSPPGGAAG